MHRNLPILNAADLSLDEWLAYVTTPEHKRKHKLADYEFPTNRHRDEFLALVGTYAEQTIRTVLRCLLISGGGTLGIDETTRRWAYSLPDDELLGLMSDYEFIQRLVEPPFLPWDGITWILDLLPHSPGKALNVLNAYFTAHCQFLPDGRIHGLSDAEAIIRRRYIHWENSREALLALGADEFEYLIGALYKKLGYEVVVTRRSRDGGVDVEARRNDAGGRALVLIQCKRYENVVRVAAVRELMGVVSRRQANKGVIAATCAFTDPAKQEAYSTNMIELLDFPTLNKLLNQHFGSNWPDNMIHCIRQLQADTAKLHTKSGV